MPYWTRRLVTRTVAIALALIGVSVVTSWLLLSDDAAYERRELQIRLTVLQEFGRPTDPREATIGLISSFAVDGRGNVYVLDPAFCNIKVFSSEGQFVRTYGFGQGDGPGEFRGPSSIDVDSLGNMYVVDRTLLSVTVMDSVNQVLGVLRVPFVPAKLVVVRPFVIDLIGFPFTYRGDLIRRYYVMERDTARQLIMSYGSRLPSSSGSLVEMSGYSGRLLLDSQGKLFHSFYYPYLIRVYSPDGAMIDSIHQSPSYFVPPSFDKRGAIFSPTGIRDIAVLGKDTLLVLVQDSRSDSVRTHIDVFVGQKLSYLGFAQMSNVSLSKYEFIGSDRQGCLYGYVYFPYPRLVRLHVDISEETKQ